MVALKMAVDGRLIVLKVPAVMVGARERSVADLGYSNGKVSRKVMEACDVLNIIRTKNEQSPMWINRGLYRLLYNPTLYILAYERLKSKPGNMTPGTDGQTLDGFSLEEIYKIIDLMKKEQYQPTPVRRVHISKKGGQGKRPLGVPSPREKIVQECIRLILEAIYEPSFHQNSHGFRPGRSCHTALESLRRNWVGTKWVLKIDIAQCFETIDHHRLLDVLREKIDDDRFINLIRKFLKAGYLEKWEYHKTYSGTPQGSVVSPILTNVYLNRLDWKLEAICQQYTSGQSRKPNNRYYRLLNQRKQLLRQGQADPTRRASLKAELKTLNQRILQTPGYDFNDPAYTRVKFLRYADDMAVSITGPKALGRQVQEEIASFLEQELNLELNREKTCLIHLTTERATFLGYVFKTSRGRLRRRNLNKTRSVHNVNQTRKTTSGNIQLLVPLKNLSEKLNKYQAHGQPEGVSAFINQPVAHIIDHYNGLIRGWYNYYQLAENVGRLNYARYVLQYSLVKTLAHKERTTVYKIFRKYGKDITHTKPNGRSIHFFNQPLKQVKKAKRAAANLDTIPTWFPRRTQSRLLDNCAICNSPERVEMHHVKHIRKRGQNLKGFSLYMAAINRKQVPVCHKCHREIHKGKYDGASLAQIEAQIQAHQSVSQGPSL
jgi:group II intron reverse transcriptase/maturase